MKTKILLIIIFLNIPLIAQQLDDNIKYELDGVLFHGNSTIPTGELEEVVLSKASPNWISQFINSFTSFGASAVYFDSLLIPTDVSIIKDYYKSKGFFKTRVFPKYELDKEAKSAVLIYNIQEKDRASFRKFTFTGLDSVPDEVKKEISAYIKTDTSQYFTNTYVEEKKNYAINYLKNHGYMMAKVEPPIVYIDTLINKVDLEINFYTGNRYKISEIRTVRRGPGKDLVEDDLLKKLVNIKQWQYYSNYEIERGQVRLYRSNLFTSALVNAEINDTTGNQVPILISADIGLMNELSPEIIMNDEDNQFNLGLSANYTRKNFFGDARKFSVGASVAAQNFTEFIKNPSFADSSIYGYTDTRVGIEQPFIFGEPINTKFETYVTFQKRKAEYSSFLYGGKLSFDFEVPQYIYLTGLNAYLNIERSEYDYRLDYIKKSFHSYLSNFVPKNDLDSLMSEIFEGASEGDFTSKSTNMLIGVNLITNKSNDFFFPTRGFLSVINIEDGNSIPYLITKIAGNQLDVPSYIKIQSTTSVYLPFYNGKENAFAVKLKVGQIFTYSGDKSEIPLNQRFYAGGSNSVRGWASRELVPLTPIFNLTSTNLDQIEAFLIRRTIPGGFFLFEGSIETRNRLIGQIGSAIFLDYGNTWNDYSEFRFDQVAIAVGFGIRYYSDFAPIRIDFGFKAYDPEDSRAFYKKRFLGELLQFHVGIGEAF